MLKLIVLGGPVMIPLLLCSVLALAISIDRLWYLLRSRVDSEDLMEDIRLALEQGKVLEAMQIAKRTRGPVAAVLAAGIAYYDRDQEEIAAHMEMVGKEEIFKMERRLNALDTIVTIAPLLGILGTVTGIINSFNVLAGLEGVVNHQLLSVGIAEALLTTATGLIIAIPSSAVYSYVNTLIDRNMADMSKRSSELLGLLKGRSDE
ncbi:MAG: MotA/TolQ/ExbB proton channel family protein [Firmicutes bacterium]|jgi:biopolymer transport protein ExbB|nr:MotA/TolQ/ExbB proton channel family protein [Bacillota bacterium]